MEPAVHACGISRSQSPIPASIQCNWANSVKDSHVKTGQHEDQSQSCSRVCGELMQVNERDLADSQSSFSSALRRSMLL